MAEGAVATYVQQEERYNKHHQRVAKGHVNHWHMAKEAVTAFAHHKAVFQEQMRTVEDAAKATRDAAPDTLLAM